MTRLPWLRAGLTIVVSDFLIEGAWEPALVALGQSGQEPLLWQVLAPEEEKPEFRGDVRLTDVESGGSREMTITPGVVRDYIHALAEHREGLQRQAAAAGARFLHTRSDEDLRASMTTALRAGVVSRA